MASGKSFITALFLVVVFSSMSLRVEGRHLLQVTTQPNLPNPTLLPPLPSNIPTLPQANMPPMPTIPSLPTMPTLPSLNLPPLPSIPTNIPSLFPFFSPPPSTSSTP
ncbi:verprolin [Cajanus cajan]|uniref:verprolin n=1 Tax=Cajanus cajan TaxID=3821 RepID=UPI00098DAB6E|nr:verprolin [Cajanus cajan]